jgi:hypothetical protein
MKQVMDSACFTISDMAVWFDVSRSTMNSWLTIGKYPQRIRREPLARMLVVLEDSLKSSLTKDLLPVPLSIRQHKRKEYIEKIRGHAFTELSKSHSARRRVQVLGNNKQI